MNISIHKNDTVLILQGKDRGKKAKVLKVLPRSSAVLVEGVNLAKTHVRSRTPGQQGQIVSREHPLPTSRVQLFCDKCGKASRVGFSIKGDKKTRVCRRCGLDI